MNHIRQELTEIMLTLKRRHVARQLLDESHLLFFLQYPATTEVPPTPALTGLYNKEEKSWVIIAFQ